MYYLEITPVIIILVKVYFNMQNNPQGIPLIIFHFYSTLCLNRNNVLYPLDLATMCNCSVMKLILKITRSGDISSDLATLFKLTISIYLDITNYIKINQTCDYVL